MTARCRRTRDSLSLFVRYLKRFNAGSDDNADLLPFLSPIISFWSPMLWTTGRCYFAIFFFSCLVFCCLDPSYPRTVLCPTFFTTGSSLLRTPRQMSTFATCAVLRYSPRYGRCSTALYNNYGVECISYIVMKSENMTQNDPRRIIVVDPRGEGGEQDDRKG
jgi:hypothetical protein